MTATPDFKVTPFFDAEYLRNGTNTDIWNTNWDLYTHALLNSVISSDLMWP